MANLPDPPFNAPFSSTAWRSWFGLLAKKIGSAVWASIDLQGSSLADLESRRHDDLQEIPAVDPDSGDGVRNKHLANADLQAITAHRANTANPHATSKEQVGLGEVVNGLQLLAHNNLNDLPDKSQSRDHLGLGSAAILNDGLLPGNLVRLDDGGCYPAADGSAIRQITTSWERISGKPTIRSMAAQESSNVTITGGSLSGIADLAVVDGGTGASDAATARTNLGLGDLALQTANAVTITGGSLSGIADLAVADGGTGASTIYEALNNLGVITGSGTLVNGVATVAVGLVTATSTILVSHKTISGTPGYLYPGNIVPGTSFQIFSTNASDNSTFNYHMIEQSILPFYLLTEAGARLLQESGDRLILE